MSMFYDLPDPTSFVDDVASVLADDGIWILEQSYMPTMIDVVSYDTVCHEHLEYYALKQIQWLVVGAGMKIIDVTLNDVNGGSFQVVVSKDVHREANQEAIDALLIHEEEGGYSSGAVFEQFRKNIEIHKKAVLEFFETAKKENKKVI
jgi:NDP-4-keto-2,6-dideoxyhexose 3-C-methyltransferase